MEEYPPILMFSLGLLIDKCPFKTGQCLEKTALFRAYCQQVWHILQLNIEGLTASKMNVLYYLALQFEVLVILLHETHCTDADIGVRKGGGFRGQTPP